MLSQRMHESPFVWAHKPRASTLNIPKLPHEGSLEMTTSLLKMTERLS